MSEINKCPYCGKDMVLDYIGENYIISCPSYNCILNIYKRPYFNKEISIWRWNTATRNIGKEIDWDIEWNKFFVEGKWRKNANRDKD